MGGLAGVPPSDRASAPVSCRNGRSNHLLAAHLTPLCLAPWPRRSSASSAQVRTRKRVAALSPDASVARMLGLGVLRNGSSCEYKEMLTFPPGREQPTAGEACVAAASS